MGYGYGLATDISHVTQPLWNSTLLRKRRENRRDTLKRLSLILRTIRAPMYMVKMYMVKKKMHLFFFTMQVLFHSNVTSGLFFF